MPLSEPCPFCGNENDLTTDEKDEGLLLTYAVVCPRCFSCGPRVEQVTRYVDEAKAAAWRKWNERPGGTG